MPHSLNSKKCSIDIFFDKGQLIYKCPFGIIVWTKIPTKLFLDFCPEFFCCFLGASWKLFGLPGNLVCYIISKEAYRKPQKASNTVVQEAMHTAYTRVWNKWVICLKMKKESTYMHLFAWCLSFSTKIPIHAFTHLSTFFGNPKIWITEGLNINL